MNKEKIKAVLFDFIGTLDNDGKEWGLRLWEQLKKGGLIINKNDFKKATKKSIEMLFNDNKSSSLSYKETIEIFIFWTIKHLELIIKDYKNVLVEPFYFESKKYLERNKRFLEKLSEKYTLGIISNNFGNCKGWCKEFNIDKYFKTIIDSSTIGFKKPGKKIFKIACSSIGFLFEECVYVGDKYEKDIKPVIELGMLPIWINSNNNKKKINSEIIMIKTLTDLEKIFDLKKETKLLI